MMDGMKMPNMLSRLKQQETPAVAQGEITACVGRSDDFMDENGMRQDAPDHTTLGGAEDVIYFEFDPEHNSTTRRRQVEMLDAAGHKHGGIDTYVISTVNGKDKKSRGYAGCTGIALVGYDPKLKQNISILIHNSPPALGFGRFRLEGEKSDTQLKFEKHFNEVASRFMSNVDVHTVSAVVFGGRTDPNEDINFEKNINEAKKLVRNVVGVEAGEVIAPNDGLDERIDAYLKTQERKLFISRRVRNTS